MAKLSPGAISEKDLLESLERESDFGFEMQVLNALRTLEFDCSHSATYQDPDVPGPGDR